MKIIILLNCHGIVYRMNEAWGVDGSGYNSLGYAILNVSHYGYFVPRVQKFCTP
jgi:hypothetical protein